MGANVPVAWEGDVAGGAELEARSGAGRERVFRAPGGPPGGRGGRRHRRRVFHRDAVGAGTRQGDVGGRPG